MSLLKTIIAIIAKLSAIGLPPGVLDEQQFRAWCANLADAIAELAALTPTPADDLAGRLLNLATDNDEVWSLLYSLLAGQLTDPPVTLAGPTEPQMVALANETGIGIAELIVLIPQLVELIRLIRELRKR